MSEAAPPATAGKEEQAKPNTAPKGHQKKPAAPQLAKKREKKSWTVEKCMRAARRFTNVEEWQTGAPSSFKAAEAKGWIKECSAHMQGGSKVKAVKPVAKTAKSPGPVHKKSA